MVVCSCNRIDTSKIRAAIEYIHEPNEKLVLNILAWSPECAQCCKVLTDEIRKNIKEMIDVG